MKQRGRYILGSGLAMFMLALAPVAAAATGGSSSASDRLNQIRVDLSVTLTKDQLARYKSRCQAAQTAIGNVNQRLTSAVTVRTKAYDDISASLTKIMTRLPAAKVDTIDLKQDQTALTSKIAVYKADLVTYQRLLTDLKAIDCASDPTTFAAGLQAARTAHDGLVTDASAVSNFISQTLKPTLELIALKLQPSTTTTTGNQ